MNKSPSVSIIERDMSTYSVTSSSTTIAVVGYATKGPIGKATLVTSLQDFREQFGYAALIPYSYLAIAKAFNQTNKVIFTRVADDTATASQKVINNLVSQVNGYTTLTKNTDVTSAQSGYHAGEMYGITVEGRNFFVSSKSSSNSGWGIDNMIYKLSAELAATSGFQEFSNKSVITSTSGVYGFKLSANGNAVPAGQNKNFLITITNTDTLTTLATKINAQIVAGTRSYAYATIDASKLTSLPNSTYYFKVQVGANAVVEYSIAVSGSLTYKTLAGLMNNACAGKDLGGIEASRVGVFGVDNTTKSIIIYAANLGNVGAITVTAGTTGTDLLSASTVMFGSWTATEVGSTGVVNGNAAVIAEKHIDTERIRITSLTTGSTSAIAIAAPDALFANADASLITLLGSTMPAIAGKNALTTITVTRDSVTRKIKFTMANNTVAPVVASLESSPNYYSLSTLLTGTGLTAGIDASVNGTAAVGSETSDKVIIESLEKGSATNLIDVVKSTRVDPLTSVSTITLEIYYNNILKETFSGMTLGTTDLTFVETVVNATPESGGSSWISIDTVDTLGNNTIVFPDGSYSIGAPDSDTEQVYDDSHFTVGTYDYKVGTDGIPQIGGEELFLAQLNTAADLGNDETNDFHILIIPDNTTEAVQNAAISLAESRQDFMYIVDPALGLSYSQAKDWHNGIGGYGRTAAVGSSYAAVYWPWLKEYDADNKKYVWCPPSVFMGEKLLEVDRIYNPWYAPAGDQRGRLVAQDIETSPSFAQREVLYGDLNCVNPIVKFVGKGIEIYGQKTALRQQVASNRINIKRMLIYIKKLVKSALNSMIFEPNNPDSWQVATNLITSILEPIRQDNGLTQYRVVIDATINTPDVIAQNMMKGVIKMIPTNTIEMIEMNIHVYKSGATIS